MPNQITSTGLVTKTAAELISEYTANFQAIYGSDINVDPDTPDGQMIRIFIQSVLDLEDLLTSIYNNFDPDLAFGASLDQRVAINGIQRKAGTYTVTNITVVTTDSVTLQGLDLYPNDPYTVSDNAGTEWYLETTQTPSIAGTYVYSFRAKNPGATLTIPNTITIPVTVVIGVASVNNPTTYTSLGLNEETDAELKVRRQKSVSLSSQGYLQGLISALQNISGLTTAIVYENNTDTTDGNGIDGHSIWVIVGGTAAAVDIATAIYNKRNAGCGMKGSETYTITQVDGSPFVVKWDEVQTEDLYIKFTATSIDGVNPPDIASITNDLPGLLNLDVGARANINQVVSYVQDIDSNTLVTFSAGQGLSLSSGGTYYNTLDPSALNNKLTTATNKIIVLPMLMTPSTATVASGGATQQFTAYGGYGAYTWSIFSGSGSVSSGGLFTSASSGTTIVRATDTLGNYVDATVTVT